MYSNHENVNILTALLVTHGVHHAVVCPGSRNAPIVHNLNECPDIQCYPVTDERSAGFYALGMVQSLGQPVVVCVTSGTALLNLAPAVAEAYYQHRNIVVVSADRPQQWIDQLDGQTLPQPDALGRFVRKSVSLPEPQNDEQRWYCNRLVNEALMTHKAPVHINVPITEPLFGFSVPQLPTQRSITLLPADIQPHTLSHVVRRFMQAERPMLISGQPMNPLMDEAVLLAGNDERYVPDFVLYTGDAIVSKRLKHFLRKARETWAVNATGEVNDTFMNLTQVIQGDAAVVADQVKFLIEQDALPFVMLWEKLLERARAHADNFEPEFSQMAVVKYLEHQLDTMSQGDIVTHYANSTAIRLANIYARHSVFCNRGVNGIEGSLSTAAGYSCVTDEMVLCVIGDLSFLYDQNALWNQNLRGNLRILLLNNGKGGIFNMLPGLQNSPARDALVAAAHHTSAEGICRQNGISYLPVRDASSMHTAIDTLLSETSDLNPTGRPLLVEVFTDAQEDERNMRAYYDSLH